MKAMLQKIPEWLYDRMLAVPVGVKVVGIGLLPIVILGLTLNYWITTGLSDWLSYILTDVRVQAAMEAGGRSVFLVTLLAAIASIFFSMLLSFILSRPILALKEMAQQVASGNLNARAQIWAKDEIGELAVAINTMTDHLVDTQKDLERKNRNLDVINQVALAGDQQKDVHDILYEILQNILNSMHLKKGWIYLRDPEKNTFHLASWYGIEKGSIPNLLHGLSESTCTCQLDLMQEISNEHVEIHTCDRLRALTHLNIEKAHISIPLIAREQKFGVINLLCDENLRIPDDDWELLVSLGNQISEIVANAWLHLKLVEKEAARQVLLRSLVEAQEEERRRLARELHDGAGQTLTSLLVRLKTIEKKTDRPQVKNDLQSMQNLVSETIEQIRTLAHQLRPAALEQFGLSLALESLIKEISEHGNIEATYGCKLQVGEIPDEIEAVLYRIAQEGLTNIIRHAHCTHLSLMIENYSQGVSMAIEDDGVGFDPANLGIENGQRHLGLISMKERAEILGGTLDVFTAPGKGTTIQVHVPIGEY